MKGSEILKNISDVYNSFRGGIYGIWSGYRFSSIFMKSVLTVAVIGYIIAICFLQYYFVVGLGLGLKKKEDFNIFNNLYGYGSITVAILSLFMVAHLYVDFMRR